LIEGKGPTSSTEYVYSIISRRHMFRKRSPVLLSESAEADRGMTTIARRNLRKNKRG